MYSTQEQAIEQACHREPHGENACRASACMGWRWGQKLPKPITIACENKGALVAEDGRAGIILIPDGYQFQGAELMEAKGAEGNPMIKKAAHWVEPQGSCYTRRKGFCGPCGVPEYE